MRPASLTSASASTAKTPKSGVAAALLRATVRLAAPGPSMSVSPVVLLRSGRAEVSTIVCGEEKTVGSNWITLPRGFVSASAWEMT